MLGGFGFEFLCSCYIWHIGEVYAQTVMSEFPPQLPNCLEEWERFDVAYHPAYFGNYEVETAGVAQLLHIAFYLVGDVGYNLHRLAQVVAASFLVDDAAVDAAGGHIVGAGCPDVGETFIVAQVEVGLMPVDGYIAFAVFIGVERAGVDVDIGVEFLNRDPVAPGYQQIGQRRRDYAFPEGGNHAAGDEDVLCIHCSKCFIKLQS